MYILTLCIFLSICSIMVRRQSMEIFIYVPAPYVEKSTNKKVYLWTAPLPSSEVECVDWCSGGVGGQPGAAAPRPQ
jgi:hypothetical protein